MWNLSFSCRVNIIYLSNNWTINWGSVFTWAIFVLRNSFDRLPSWSKNPEEFTLWILWYYTVQFRFVNRNDLNETPESNDCIWACWSKLAPEYLPISLKKKKKKSLCYEVRFPFALSAEEENESRIPCYGETWLCSQNENELSDIKGMYILFEGGFFPFWFRMQILCWT